MPDFEHQKAQRPVSAAGYRGVVVLIYSPMVSNGVSNGGSHIQHSIREIKELCAFHMTDKAKEITVRDALLYHARASRCLRDLRIALSPIPSQVRELRRDLDPDVACTVFLGALELAITSLVLRVVKIEGAEHEAGAYYARVARTVVEICMNGMTPPGGTA